MKKTILITIFALLLSLVFASASAVEITPSNPDNGDDLVCDVPSSSATFDYYWYEETELIQKDLNEENSVLDSSKTEEGKLYTCSVFLPETGLTDSYYIGEDTVTVQESNGNGNEDNGFSVHALQATDAHLQIDPGAKIQMNVVVDSSYLMYKIHSKYNNMFESDTVYIYDQDDTFDKYYFGEPLSIKGIWDTKMSDRGYYEAEFTAYDEYGKHVDSTVEITIDYEFELNNPFEDPETGEVNHAPVLDNINDVVVEEGDLVIVTAHAVDQDADLLTFAWNLDGIDAEIEDSAILYNYDFDEEDNGKFDFETEEGVAYPVAKPDFEKTGKFDYESKTGVYVVVRPNSGDGKFDFETEEGVAYPVARPNSNPEVVFSLDNLEIAPYTPEWLSNLEYESSEAYSTLTWQTALGDEGVYTITVYVQDEHGLSDTETFTITVEAEGSNGDNHSPNLNLNDVEVDEGELVELVAEATDVDGDVLTYEWYLDDNMNDQDISVNGNTLTWLTDCDDSGLYQVTVTVWDPHGGSDTETATIKINDVESCDVYTSSDYEGDKLYVKEIRVMNAAEIASNYEIPESMQITATGDYKIVNGVLTSTYTDNEAVLLITLHNKNSFDARDLKVTFILDGERTYSTFQDLDRSEKASKTFNLEIPNNLETGRYALKVTIENDDLYTEKYINLDIKSLGDVVTEEIAEEQEKTFWEKILEFFNF